MKQFWFFWWDIIVSHTHGMLVRRRGAKILFVDRGTLVCGFASVRSSGAPRYWYVRYADASDASGALSEIARVDLADRGLTWVYDWNGETADAFRAQHMLGQSVS